MKTNTLSRARIVRLLPALLFAALGVQGCSWNESEYERYVGSRGYVEKCEGICVLENIPKTKDDCEKNSNLVWTDAICLKDNKFIDASTEADCKDDTIKGTWIPGECKIINTNKDECESDKVGGKWANFQLYEIGNGQYLWNDEGKYYCGNYQEIVEGIKKPCNNLDKHTLDKYIDDIQKYHLCESTSFCRSVPLKKDEDLKYVAACTTCPKGNIKCGNECVDIMNSKDNCGGCNIVCNSEQGEFCDSGECVSSCKNSVDENNEETRKKICNVNGQLVCQDIDNNPEHCGECGNNCNKDNSEIMNWMCKKGKCIPVDSCAKSQIKCYCLYDEDGNIKECSAEKLDKSELLCINKNSIDSCGAQNCQDRGRICSIGQICVENTDGYECKCADGLIKYGEKCLNPYNPETCGVNEDELKNNTIHSCGKNEICDGKECLCIQGFDKCDGEDGCVNILNNPHHCGSCSTDCGKNSYCDNGGCKCNDGFSRCEINNSGEVVCGESIPNCTESKYNNHCGAQGVANDPNPGSENFSGYVCDQESRCYKEKGKWVCGCDDFICDNLCIDPDTNIKYCGAKSCEDGINCFLEGRNTECVSGKCECKGDDMLFVGVIENDGALHYTTDLTDKDIIRFDCINTKTDPLCCGGKKSCLNNNICDSNKVCINGYCEENCPDGYANCNGNCINKSIYNVKELENGHCECDLNANDKYTCPANGNPDNGCLVEQGDENNCGGCGNKCEPTYSCIQNTSCRCGNNTSECEYEIGEYDNNQMNVKRCMNLSVLKMKECKTCEFGWGNLDKNWANGCESDLSTNIYHCGVENNDCTVVCDPNDVNCVQNVVNAGGVVCRNGSCGYSTCNNLDYLNCDGDVLKDGYYFANPNNEHAILGCETNIKTDINNCRMCEYKCVSNTCEDGKCCYKNEKDIYLDLSQFECCSNNILYQYKHNWWKGCYDSSHYGCSENELKGDGNFGINCWSMVE